MAINVGSAIAYLELDTSQFIESIKGAGSELEGFASSREVIIVIGDTMDEVSLSAQGLNMSLQDTAVAVSNMVISIASSIMELKICLSELKEAIIEIMEAVKDLADALLDGLVNALNKVKDLVKSGIFTLLYDEIMKVSNALSSLISQVSKIGILEEAFRNLTKTIEDTSKAARDLSASFDEMKNKIELFTDAVLKLKNKIEELTEAEKADTIQVNNLKDAVTGLRDSVELCLIPFSLFAAALKLCDYEAKALAKTINEELKPALDSLKEISISLSIELSGKLTNSTKQAGDSAEDLGNKLKESAEKGEESTGMFSSIRKALEPFISKVKEIISFVEEWIGKFKKLIEILNTIKDFASKFEKLSKLVSILEKIISFLEKIIAPIEKVIEVVKKVMGAFESLEAASSVFAEMAAIITPEVALIVAAIALIAGAVYLVYKNWEGIKEFFDNLWEGVKGIFNKFWVWLQNFFKQWDWIIDKFKEFGTNLAEGISEGLKIGWNLLVEGVKWVVSNMIEFFKELLGINSPSKVFAEFGGFIVDGLIDGLKAGWNKLKEGVAGLANLVKSIFASETETHSPSQVFVRFGNYIGDGLVLGLGEREDHISNKIKNITDKIKNIGSVSPDLKNLNNLDLKGNYKLSGQIQDPQSSRQFNFTPNITMHISVADTGAKGTAQLASELKTMAQNAIKNSMVDEFMADALRL